MDALSRIFKICDINKDGILDAGELNDFQVSGSIVGTPPSHSDAP